jgi:long-chain fatty acid transport protein
MPDDGLSYINARRQGVPRWELYDTRTQLLYLEACAAIRPWPFIEVGGGIGYLTATRGSFGIRGRADIISPYDSQLEHQVDADLTAVRYPQAGIRLLLDGWGALGVTYRGQSNLDLNIEALLDGIVDFAGIEVPLLYELEASTIAGFTPQQVAMGLTFTRVEDLSINFDLTWVNWSAYESPTAELLARLEVDPPPGTPVELPDEPEPTVLVPPEFSDRFVPRAGIEYRGARFAKVEVPARVGYVYERSPVPDQPGVTNLIDADRHTVTVGLGVLWKEPFGEILGALSLDAHGLFSILPERTFVKDNPADFVGDYRANGNIFGAGGDLTVTF